MRQSVLAVATLFTALISAPAHAAQMSLVYSPVLSVPQPTTNGGGIGSAGGGLLVEFRKTHIGLELGTFYQTQILNGTSSGNAVVTLMPRLWLGRVFGVGAGGYGGYQLSNVGSNDNPLDYGLVGKAGFNLPLGKSLGLVVESSYRYGLASQTKTGARVTLNQITGIVGFRLGAI